MVVPVVIKDKTGKTYQYKKGSFALQGCGGGLNNMSLLMKYLSQHKSQGYKVSVIPLVVENELLNGFQFFDSQITLTTLLDDNIDLILYRKNQFEWIYHNYKQLENEFEKRVKTPS